jgi:hypothetical protein
VSVTGNKKPIGFPDYYTWLLNNCVIISVQDKNQNLLLEQLDLFIKKLYKNAVFCAEIIEGRPARIIYHNVRYYNGILRALQVMNLFTVQRESSQLVLRPIKANILGELKAVVGTMKDSAKFVITGRETIETRDGETVHPGNLVISQFRTIASRQFGMQAAEFAISSQYLEGYVHDEAIIRYVLTHKETFPARYLVICVSGTRLDKGMAEYRIPPVISASCRFTLFDMLTGETIESDEARTTSGGFSPADLGNRAVLEESRRALQFLYNPKTQPGLGEIIRDVMEKL